MRKSEIAEIVVIIHKQSDPEKLLGQFVDKFPKYASLIKKYYKGHLKSLSKITKGLKNIYGEPMKKLFNEAILVFDSLPKSKGKGYKFSTKLTK